MEEIKQLIKQVRDLNAWNRKAMFDKRMEAEIDVYARGSENETIRMAKLLSVKHDTKLRDEIAKIINTWLDDKEARIKVKHDAALQQLLDKSRDLESMVTELKSELGIVFIHGVKDKSVIVDECSEIEALINEYEAFQTIQKFTGIKVTKMEFIVGKKAFRMGRDF